MATNEKITLNVDLYDNIMTEQKGDYTGLTPLPLSRQKSG